MHCATPSSEQTVVLSGSCPAPLVRPLSSVRIDAAAQAAVRLRVEDGRGRVYVDRPADPPTFIAGGAPGWQRARLLDDAGAVIAEWPFRVACETRIEDAGGRFGSLLAKLHLTVLRGSEADTVAVNGKLYRHYVCWLRDHTHVLKGMKYFDPGDLKTGLELYADTQRADGMIYDRIAPKANVQGWRDYTFANGDFIRTLDSGMGRTYSLQRIPVENDVEFLFIECLYRTWQATGDTPWMTQYLDHARKAVHYATSDPYRWSGAFALLKRGYTIDTWDFMHTDDSRLTLGDNICDLQRTTFGVMHGDNTGMAAACRMLAEMLRAGGQAAQADEYDRLGEALLQRLAKVAWDSRGYYRHHVSEDPSFKRDVGDTDESAQVSLSNAYALHRGIGADKCRAIIETYQRIRREMPPASPGEFYHIYPPFEKGFGPPCDKWQYMNGGVSTIVAGELACGAFKHGRETYGVDILRRLNDLADRHGGHLDVCFNGNPQTTPPPRNFAPQDLSSVATITAAHRESGGWGEAGNDLSRMPTGEVCYHHVPFRICPDGRGIGVARDKKGYPQKVRVPVGGRHASVYLLHTCSQPQVPTATLDVHYTDGQIHRVYLTPGTQLESWFMPGAAEGNHRGCHAPRLREGWPAYQLAWRGANDTFENVGTFIWGWNNPRPEVAIESLEFNAAENDSIYFVPAITFSDQPVWFPQSDVSFGIPDAWGAAAVVFALIEGLAGVEDTSTMFESAELSPRWSAAGVDEVAVCVAYPASGGYVAYRYRHDPGARRITLQVTGSGRAIDCRVLLPAAARSADCPVEQVGDSHYAHIALQGPGPQEIEIQYV